MTRDVQTIAAAHVPTPRSSISSIRGKCLKTRAPGPMTTIDCLVTATEAHHQRDRIHGH